jgi:hypothetical protein
MLLLKHFWPTACTRPWATSDTIMEWLRLQTNTECFQPSFQTYTRCLRTFICCSMWAAGSTSSCVTMVCPDLGVQQKTRNHTWATSDTIVSIGWGSTSTWNVFIQHSKHMYKVFENSYTLCLVGRIHHHAVATTVVGPDLGVWQKTCVRHTCVQVIQLFGVVWGSRPTWNVSNLHSKHIQGVWDKHSYAVSGGQDPSSCHCHNCCWLCIHELEIWPKCLLTIIITEIFKYTLWVIADYWDSSRD